MYYITFLEHIQQKLLHTSYLSLTIFNIPRYNIRPPNRKPYHPTLNFSYIPIISQICAFNLLSISHSFNVSSHIHSSSAIETRFAFPGFIALAMHPTFAFFAYCSFFNLFCVSEACNTKSSASFNSYGYTICAVSNKRFSRFPSFSLSGNT